VVESASAPERAHPRFVVDVMVEIATPAGAPLSGRTRNVSRGGLCVELGEAVAPGQEVEIRMALLFEDDEMSEPLGLPARVVWCTPLGRVYQIGGQFRALSRHQAAYLDLFLSYIDAARAPDPER
jgi:Tfp pilus assembly protein PilZ